MSCLLWLQTLRIIPVEFTNHPPVAKLLGDAVWPEWGFSTLTILASASPTSSIPAQAGRCSL